MSDYLLIGDPHVKQENLEESRRLIVWLAGICRDRDLTAIFFGDQYDSHAVARVEVISFWHWAFDQFHKKPVAFDGNHDMNMAGTMSLMVSHRHQVRWVTTTEFGDGNFCLSPETPKIGVLPFIRSNEAFVAAAKALAQPGQLIFCHAEFNGAKYDNGFYAPGGINLDDIPGVFFISGHLHTRQSLGDRCFYVGTPRQLTKSDAGHEKGVYVFSPATGGMEFIATPAEVCEPYQVFVITPDSPKVKIPDSVKSLVQISGPKEFCQKAATKLPPSVRVSISPLSETVVTVRESDGVNVAFAKFLSEYKQKNGLAGDTVEARIFEKCPSLR